MNVARSSVDHRVAFLAAWPEGDPQAAAKAAPATGASPNNHQAQRNNRLAFARKSGSARATATSSNSTSQSASVKRIRDSCSKQTASPCRTPARWRRCGKTRLSRERRRNHCPPPFRRTRLNRGKKTSVRDLSRHPEWVRSIYLVPTGDFISTSAQEGARRDDAPNRGRARALRPTKRSPGHRRRDALCCAWRNPPSAFIHSP